MQFFHIFSVLNDYGVKFCLGDFKNVRGSFYVIENKAVRELCLKDLLYGKKPTKPDVTFEEVNARLRQCKNLDPWNNYEDLVRVLGFQLGLFSMSRGNVEHHLMKWCQFRFGRLSVDLVRTLCKIIIILNNF